MSTSLGLARVPDGRSPREPGDRYDLWLLGPYFGLHEPADCSLHTSSVPRAYEELDTALPPTPFQLHPPRGLRLAVADQTGRPELAAARPGDLPAEYWTDRWGHVAELTGRASTLTQEARLRLGVLHCALGMDAAAQGVLPDLQPEEATASPIAAAIAMKLTHVRKRLHTDAASVRRDREVLAAVATAARIPARSALGAATTLVVLHARGTRPDVAAVRHWRRLAEERLARLDGADWRDRLAVSTFWRAVSYLPFLQGDHARTAAELDLAEEAARSMPAATEQEDLVRRQNLHPLLETRTRAALARGTADAALGYAREAAELDPHDGKVHITLGDVLARAGDRAQARASYLRAVALGAPYAPKAQNLLAGSLEAEGDHEAAMYAYLRVLDLDRGAYSACAAAHRLAGQLGTKDVMDWAASWRAAARERAEAGQTR
ncbi:hypothetical protein [Nonomuraea sp. NPDC049141]|uniref:hypothetical protein n=1 Tax=Nonomuraea sp. NPDC049141 TaxID=3155500 RepID=UPI0033DC62D5